LQLINEEVESVYEILRNILELAYLYFCT